MTVIWCTGFPEINAHLEEGRQGQSGMKLIQCSGLPEIYGQLEEGGEVCLHCYLCICLYVKLSQYSGFA